MLPDEKISCPYSGFRISCFEGVTKHKCPKWVHITGKNPQTEETIDKYGCADTFLPMLMIENAQMSRQTGAAVESLRNVVADINGYVPTGTAPKLIEYQRN